MVRSDGQSLDILKPFLIADDFLSTNPPAPKRFVIDFGARTVFQAEGYRTAMERVKRMVLPARQKKAEKEEVRNEEAVADNPRARVNHHHRNFLEKWWLHSYPRKTLMTKLRVLPRYVACARVTKRPIFVFVCNTVNPNDALQVFTFQDDYSFGILQSNIHWRWFVERCSTLKGDFRYTSNTVYDSFPWPQSPTLGQVRSIASAAVDLRALRAQIMTEHGYTLRDLYRMLELPGDNPLKDAHERLDAAVRKAYDMTPKANVLEFLFQLNQSVAQRERSMQPVMGPGLPSVIKQASDLITTDCISPETV